MQESALPSRMHEGLFIVWGIYAAKGLRERKLQRALIQYDNPENRKYVIEALKKLNRMDLAKIFLSKSYPQRSAPLRVRYKNK